ncbi:MAG: hypothetical protein ACT4PW_04970 [Acidimicrobiia bacterium]
MTGGRTRSRLPGTLEGQITPGVTPVLDIGDDIGAVVAYLDAVPAGGELDICPAGRPEARFHTGVHLRAVAGAEVPVALFPAVLEGRYEILDHRLAPVAALDVIGGHVTEVRLSAPAR